METSEINRTEGMENGLGYEFWTSPYQSPFSLKTGAFKCFVNGETDFLEYLNGFESVIPLELS